MDVPHEFIDEIVLAVSAGWGPASLVDSLRRTFDLRGEASERVPPRRGATPAWPEPNRAAIASERPAFEG